jgi:hypothetical protein
MRRRSSTALTAVGSVVLAVGAMACSLGDIYNGECGYVGEDRYETGALTGAFSDPKTGTVTLKGDGTFTASGLRVRGAAGEEQFGGRGTWSLRARPTPADNAEAGRLVLTFVRDDGTTEDWTRINPGGSTTDSVEYLYYLYGDLESCDLQKIPRVPTAGQNPETPTRPNS